VNHGTSVERQSDAACVFDEHRNLLVSVAYRVLGSVTDAEDAVQEAWLRWSNVDHSGITDPRAFLVRVTTSLAIDRLRRAKARRESYVGPWLPEPVLTVRPETRTLERASRRAERLFQEDPKPEGEATDLPAGWSVNGSAVWRRPDGRIAWAPGRGSCGRSPPAARPPCGFARGPAAPREARRRSRLICGALTRAGYVSIW
jgi:hypothetical protein